MTDNLSKIVSEMRAEIAARRKGASLFTPERLEQFADRLAALQAGAEQGPQEAQQPVLWVITDRRGEPVGVYRDEETCREEMEAQSNALDEIRMMWPVYDRASPVAQGWQPPFQPITKDSLCAKCGSPLGEFNGCVQFVSFASYPGAYHIACAAIPQMGKTMSAKVSDPDLAPVAKCDKCGLEYVWINAAKQTFPCLRDCGGTVRLLPEPPAKTGEPIK